MAKKVTGSVKLQIAAGKATPAPPVGPALGQAQINIMEFCKQFNAKTSGKDQEGLIIPVVITVYTDRSFTFITKTPPASVLLKRAAAVAGSGVPTVARLKAAQGTRQTAVAPTKIAVRRHSMGRANQQSGTRRSASGLAKAETARSIAVAASRPAA